MRTNKTTLVLADRIYTMDSGRPQATSMLVSPTGQVLDFDVHHGDTEILLTKDTQVVHLPAGSVVVPGLRDRHTHWVFSLFANCVDLSGVKTMGQVRDRLTAQMESQIEGWIVAVGWNSALIPTTILTQEVFDKILRGRRGIIFDQSYHRALITTSLAEYLLPRYPEEAVGDYRNGLIDEQKVFLAIGWLEIDGQILQKALLDRQRLMLSQGFTSVVDMGVLGQNLLAQLQDMYRSGDLFLPCEAAVQPYMLRENADLMARQDGALNLRWLKHIADGSFGARTAFLCDGCHYHPSRSRGVNLINPDRYFDDVMLARLRGFTASAVHCIGNGAVKEAARAFDYLISKLGFDLKGLTLSFEHMETAGLEVIRHVSALQRSGMRVEVCSQPGFNTDLTDYADRLPPEVLGYINPYADFAAEGLRWVAGTDGGITGDNPWKGMSLAVNRPGLQAITFPQVFSTFVEGALFTGGSANFAVLDHDPFSDVNSLADVKVQQTWLNGDKVYDSVK